MADALFPRVFENIEQALADRTIRVSLHTARDHVVPDEVVGAPPQYTRSEAITWSPVALTNGRIIVGGQWIRHTWRPGEPLYEHPRSLADEGELDAQVVRPMFQIINDDNTYASSIVMREQADGCSYCPDCQVTWKDDPTCWNCGNTP